MNLTTDELKKRIDNALNSCVIYSCMFWFGAWGLFMVTLAFLKWVIV